MKRKNTKQEEKKEDIIVPYKTKFVYGQDVMIKYGFYKGVCGTIEKARFNDEFDEVVYTIHVGRNDKKQVVEGCLKKIPLYSRLKDMFQG